MERRKGRLENMVGKTGDEMTGKDYFSDKNVLITGATGLVGPYVVNALLDAGVQNAVCIVRDRVPDSIFLQKVRQRNASL